MEDVQDKIKNYEQKFENKSRQTFIMRCLRLGLYFLSLSFSLSRCQTHTHTHALNLSACAYRFARQHLDFYCVSYIRYHEINFPKPDNAKCYESSGVTRACYSKKY